MGILQLCRRRTIASTAKLILEDGRLEQFSNPIMVSHILRRNPRFFICDADDLGFNEHVSAINDDEELQLGHLYFELPLSWLDSPIKAQEIAALAVKASLALKTGEDRNGSCRCCCWFWFKKVDFMMLNNGVESSPLVTSVSGGGGACGGGIVGGRRRVGGGGAEGRQLTDQLNVILE